MAEASVVRRTAAAAERLHELVSQLEPGQLQHDPIESQVSALVSRTIGCQLHALWMSMRRLASMCEARRCA
eukprot:6172984-Pleurochrysis_carterae.AAC.3